MRMDIRKHLFRLKRQDTRLRDWNPAGYVLRFHRRASYLKRQDTRLRDWNRGHLFGLPMNLLRLKRQDTRLRDWNDTQRFWTYQAQAVGLKRQDTRLRDWNYDGVTRVVNINALKRQDTRLRDWNRNLRHADRGTEAPLKRQDTRLRDWNLYHRGPVGLRERKPWKDKILDYEIETEESGGIDWTAERSTWKDKILDYEIETYLWPYAPFLQFHAWKDKILDYEIETDKTRIPINRPYSWKDKILDYEIETRLGNHHVAFQLHLKRQDTRLRDWNLSLQLGYRETNLLEKTRYSITRLKLSPTANGYGELVCNLKRQDTRLRDWNGTPETAGKTPSCRPWKDKILDYEIETFPGWCDGKGVSSWKDKILDYEIETTQKVDNWKAKLCTWKDKILDYEIETLLRCAETSGIRMLEKTRYSITRLKPQPLCRWKEGTAWLEKTRYSITRLKHFTCPWRAETRVCLKRQDTRLRDWNGETQEFLNLLGKAWKDKILDYEIETGCGLRVRCRVCLPWKDKILDYEIETVLWIREDSPEFLFLEKTRYSITRLKQHRWSAYESSSLWLEKTRYSITRLKR